MDSQKCIEYIYVEQGKQTLLSKRKYSTLMTYVRTKI